MSDLISRQTAIDALGERPMVWVSDDDYALGERNQYDVDRLAIETVPSVDAVEVVRCKDCKHWKREIHDGIEYFNFSSCDLNHYGDGHNFYCADAERRTDE